MNTIPDETPDAPQAVDEPNWYERSHELECGQIFRTEHDGWVKLDRRVPCDGTQWYAADWSDGKWLYQDSTIEPVELRGEPLNDAEFEALPGGAR